MQSDMYRCEWGGEVGVLILPDVAHTPPLLLLKRLPCCCSCTVLSHLPLLLLMHPLVLLTCPLLFLLSLLLFLLHISILVSQLYTYVYYYYTCPLLFLLLTCPAPPLLLLVHLPCSYSCTSPAITHAPPLLLLVHLPCYYSCTSPAITHAPPLLLLPGPHNSPLL